MEFSSGVVASAFTGPILPNDADDSESKSSVFTLQGLGLSLPLGQHFLILAGLGGLVRVFSL